MQFDLLTVIRHVSRECDVVSLALMSATKAKNMKRAEALVKRLRPMQELLDRMVTLQNVTPIAEEHRRAPLKDGELLWKFATQIRDACDFHEGVDIKLAVELGAIAKDRLIDGTIYTGYCRNAVTAKWNAAQNKFVQLNLKVPEQPVNGGPVTCMEDALAGQDYFLAIGVA
ncbi:MAG: hypothetical protein LW865_01930 [Betaproteobacteria bacterium]|jgi:hypothetical protein|nr:hypothetical protein [Betaproteobacteria bacterium]